MTLRKGLLVLGVVLGLFTLVGTTGCKNVCQKAADHMVDCMKSFCEENEDNAYCRNIDEVEENATSGVECGDGDEEQAQEMLDQSCEEVLEFFGLAAPSGDADEEEEAEEEEAEEGEEEGE